MSFPIDSPKHSGWPVQLIMSDLVSSYIIHFNLVHILAPHREVVVYMAEGNRYLISQIE
jgi:hypothetical protein